LLETDGQDPPNIHDVTGVVTQEIWIYKSQRYSGANRPRSR